MMARVGWFLVLVGLSVCVAAATVCAADDQGATAATQPGQANISPPAGGAGPMQVAKPTLPQPRVCSDNRTISPDGKWLCCFGNHCYATDGSAHAALPGSLVKGVWAPDSHCYAYLGALTEGDISGNGSNTRLPGWVIAGWSPTGQATGRLWLDQRQAWAGWEPVSLVGWSADSREIIVLARSVKPPPGAQEWNLDRVHRLIALTEDGKSARALLEVVQLQTAKMQFGFSPDGTRLACLWGVDTSSPGRYRRMDIVNLVAPQPDSPPMSGCLLNDACWLPDGKGLLLYLANGGQTLPGVTGPAIARCDLEGNLSLVATLDPQRSWGWGHDTHLWLGLQISADGRWLLWGGSASWLLDLNAITDPKVALTPNAKPMVALRSTQATISQDGQWVLFDGERPKPVPSIGQLDLPTRIDERWTYLLNTGKGQSRWFAPGGLSEVDWSQDGRTLGGMASGNVSGDIIGGPSGVVYSLSRMTCTHFGVDSPNPDAHIVVTDWTAHE